jgi:hypothetical protein
MATEGSSSQAWSNKRHRRTKRAAATGTGWGKWGVGADTLCFFISVLAFELRAYILSTLPALFSEGLFFCFCFFFF